MIAADYYYSKHVLHGMIELTESTASAQAVELDTRGTSGLTYKGSVLVVANALLSASSSLDHACRSLKDANEGDNSAVLNGCMYTAAVLLQSVLDGFASACNKIAGNPTPGDIYFHKYAFIHSETRWVTPVQQRIAMLRFRGTPFDDFANKLKHEEPWVGSVSKGFGNQPADGYDGVLGVYDNNSVCCLYGLLIPVYKHAVVIASRLCKQESVPVPVYPSL